MISMEEEFELTVGRREIMWSWSGWFGWISEISKYEFGNFKLIIFYLQFKEFWCVVPQSENDYRSNIAEDGRRVGELGRKTWIS